jgi:hypothetical protein
MRSPRTGEDLDDPEDPALSRVAILAWLSFTEIERVLGDFSVSNRG